MHSIPVSLYNVHRINQYEFWNVCRGLSGDSSLNQNIDKYTLFWASFIPYWAVTVLFAAETLDDSAALSPDHTVRSDSTLLS